MKHSDFKDCLDCYRGAVVKELTIYENGSDTPIKENFDFECQTCQGSGKTATEIIHADIPEGYVYTNKDENYAWFTDNNNNFGGWKKVKLLHKIGHIETFMCETYAFYKECFRPSNQECCGCVGDNNNPEIKAEVYDIQWDNNFIVKWREV